MTFSIVIPVRNGEKFLDATLTSAMSQIRAADEILAVDDASSDRSAEILKSEKWSGKIRYVRHENPTGYADAWNRAAMMACSEYVTILHQDDLLDPRYLAAAEKALAMHPSCQHLYAGCYYIDAAGSRINETPYPHSLVPIVLTGKDYAHRYLGAVVINRHIHRCPGVTTRRALFDSCTYRKEAGLIADDDFFLRVGRFTDVIGLSQPLASFRRHDDSATAKLESLSHRLAQDYLFQTKEYQNPQSFLEQSDLQLIHNQAVRFINSYFLESVIRNSADALKSAIRLRQDFEVLVEGYFQKRSSAGARLLWFLVEENETKSLGFGTLSFLLRSFMSFKKKLVS